MVQNNYKKFTCSIECYALQHIRRIVVKYRILSVWDRTWWNVCKNNVDKMYRLGIVYCNAMMSAMVKLNF